MNIQALFTQIDTNGDNVISAYEMKTAIASNTDSDLAKAYSALQSDSNFSTSKFNSFTNNEGYMSQEMLQVLINNSEEPEASEVEEVTSFPQAITQYLDALDSNSDGKYTAGEIKKAYKNATTTNQKAFLEQFMTENSNGKMVVNKELLNFLGNTEEGLFYFDKDKDGYFSNSELSALKTAQNFFYQIDKSKDGKITLSEIKNAYNSTTNDNLKAVLADYVDNTENFKNLSDNKNYINFLDLFDKLDSDNNSYVSETESENYLNTTSEFQKIDVTSDGNITLKDIQNYGLKHSDSALVNAICKTSDTSLQNKIFNIISGGKKYITASDWLAYSSQTNVEGLITEDTVNKIVQEAQTN